MEQIRNFIDMVAQGENNGAKTALEDLLSARAFETLDIKKREMSSTLFGGVSESVEHIDESYYDPKHPQSHDEYEYHTTNSELHGHPLNHITGKGNASIKDHSTKYLKKAHDAHSEVVDDEYENAHPDNNGGEKDHDAMSAHTHAKKAVNDIEKELKSRNVSVKHPIDNSHYKFD